MKTVEDLLEKGLIEVANKEEELKVFVFLFCCLTHSLTDISRLSMTLHFPACFVITIPNGGGKENL